MTTIKQVAVTSQKHAGNLGRYLDDERALSKDSQHVIDEQSWAREFHETREAYGHNEPSRPGAANTYMFHQIIGFNPDECQMNSGKMTPEKCMAFAKEWVESRYPNQEAVWVLHKERCAADKTERYAVHIGINRTDLTTGNRLNEGRSANAKIERANAMRDMDREWGLKQVEPDVRNSRVHARQPTRAEREMAERGIRSDKEYIREAIRASVKEVMARPEKNKIRLLAKSLEQKGVKMSLSKSGKDFTFERMSAGFKANGTKLGRGYSMNGLEGGLGMEPDRQLQRAVSLKEGLELER